MDGIGIDIGGTSVKLAAVAARRAGDVDRAEFDDIPGRMRQGWRRRSGRRREGDRTGLDRAGGGGAVRAGPHE